MLPERGEPEKYAHKNKYEADCRVHVLFNAPNESGKMARAQRGRRGRLHSMQTKKI